jgi:hypothetical protein
MQRAHSTSYAEEYCLDLVALSLSAVPLPQGQQVRFVQRLVHRCNVGAVQGLHWPLLDWEWEETGIALIGSAKTNNQTKTGFECPLVQ